MYRVLAVPSRDGWQLYLEAVGMVECASLDEAEARVIDLVAHELGITIDLTDIELVIN